MTKVIRMVLLAFLLQVTTTGNLSVLAQTQRPVTTAPAAQYQEELKQFDDFVALQMKLDKTPGLTIRFHKGRFCVDERIRFRRSGNKVPAKPESAYRLASVTKSMTAVAIMKLVEKKKIDLDAEVQTYVSYFPKKPWPVTVPRAGNEGEELELALPEKSYIVRSKRTLSPR